MQKLLHKKANALQAIRSLTDKMSEQLNGAIGAEAYEGILELLQERKLKMEEIDVLDKQIAFLDAVGFSPANPAEADRIHAERSAIQALLINIRESDEANSSLITLARDRVMEELKDVRDGQKGMHAYHSVSTEEDGHQLDMLR